MIVSRILSFLLRAVVVLAGLVFAASMLAAGVVLALVFVVRRLLGGQRPTAVRWRMGSARWFGHGAAARASARHAAEVVDVEAREVPASRRQLPPGA